MTEVIQFPGRRAGSTKKVADLTLCRNGHHKWQIVNSDPFAVHRGELITRYRCKRCGKEKNKAQ